MNTRPNPELIDDENPEWTDEMVKQTIRFDQLPASLQAKLRGRPKVAAPKQRVTIRLTPEVVEAFRATGKGWQGRIDHALREWVKTHPPV